MPGVFVTATGTDIGKTYVTCGLIRAARRAGRTVTALKPVLSGYTPQEAAASDAGRLAAALGEPVTTQTIARLSPWRFAAPLSPDMAAAAEGRDVSFDALVAACRDALAGETAFVEGVGGVMVPLDATHTVLDLMAALGAPVVLVGGTALGAISHGLTAVAALATKGIVPALVILDESAGSTVPTQATRATLARFLPGIGLAVLPRDAPEAAFDALWAMLAPALR